MEFWQAFALSEMDQYSDLAKIAEEVGFTGVTMGDHLVTPKWSDSKYPYTDDPSLLWDPDVPFPDPWQVISVMASMTTSLKFMTAIYILPLRDVFSAANPFQRSRPFE